MQSCEQAPGLNMLKHGQLVHQKYKDLITSSGHDKPDKFIDKIRNKLPPPEVLKAYHIYHDCGKHLCLEVDEQGRRHFPNHAEWSSKQFAYIFPDDTFSAVLIAKDMDFHTKRGEELCALCKSPFAPILLLTAFAEINANASMFGGQQSDSYKIKFKRLMKAINIINEGE